MCKGDCNQMSSKESNQNCHRNRHYHGGNKSAIGPKQQTCKRLQNILSLENGKRKLNTDNEVSSNRCTLQGTQVLQITAK